MQCPFIGLQRSLSYFFDGSSRSRGTRGIQKVSFRQLMPLSVASPDR